MVQPTDCSFTPEITGIIGSEASMRKWRSQPQPYPRTRPGTSALPPQEVGHLRPRLWPQPLSSAEIPPLCVATLSVLLVWVELCPPKSMRGRPDRFPRACDCIQRQGLSQVTK